MEGMQGAAITSFCRNRTEEAPGYSMPTFSHSANGCGGSAGWRLSAQPHSPARGMGWCKRPAHQRKPCPSSVKSQVSNHTTKLQSEGLLRGVCGFHRKMTAPKRTSPSWGSNAQSPVGKPRDRALVPLTVWASTRAAKTNTEILRRVPLCSHHRARPLLPAARLPGLPGNHHNLFGSRLMWGATAKPPALP